jgi:hypothetical protein
LVTSLVNKAFFDPIGSHQGKVELTTITVFQTAT